MRLTYLAGAIRQSHTHLTNLEFYTLSCASNLRESRTCAIIILNFMSWVELTRFLKRVKFVPSYRLGSVLFHLRLIPFQHFLFSAVAAFPMTWLYSVATYDLQTMKREEEKALGHQDCILVPSSDFVVHVAEADVLASFGDWLLKCLLFAMRSLKPASPRWPSGWRAEACGRLFFSFFFTAQVLISCVICKYFMRLLCKRCYKVKKTKSHQMEGQFRRVNLLI